MIIESSDQMPRATLLKLFPVPRNFGVAPESRVIRGKTWSAPAGAVCVKSFEIYRYDPDSGMNMDGTNWLACTKFISDMETPATIYPLANMKVIKDLVSDLTHVFAQYAMIEPWLQSRTPEPEKERLQSAEERSKLDGKYECILCFCCTSGCPSHWWNGDRFLGPAALLQAGRWLADSRDEATSRLGRWPWIRAPVDLRLRMGHSCGERGAYHGSVSRQLICSRIETDGPSIGLGRQAAATRHGGLDGARQGQIRSR
jgi:succinate dehydrogenase iron-sulfur subunit